MDVQTTEIFGALAQHCTRAAKLAYRGGQAFSVTTASIVVERFFSFAGLVKTSVQNRLWPELIDALVCYAYTNPELQQAQNKAERRRRRR